MIAAYIVSAILGGGLVLISALFGHGDHDGAQGDLHFDHDHDGHFDTNLWIPFLSLRFWTYFLAVFGVCGLLLDNFTQTPEPSVALMSAGTGLVVGLAVAYLMRVARRMEADSSVRTEDFLGMTGTVTVAIRRGSMGKIRVNMKGDLIDLLAMPNEDEDLNIGEEAVIVTMENDRARVMSRTALLEETHLDA